MPLLQLSLVHLFGKWTARNKANDGYPTAEDILCEGHSDRWRGRNVLVRRNIWRYLLSFGSSLFRKRFSRETIPIFNSFSFFI